MKKSINMSEIVNKIDHTEKIDSVLTKNIFSIKNNGVVKSTKILKVGDEMTVINFKISDFYRATHKIEKIIIIDNKISELLFLCWNYMIEDFEFVKIKNLDI